VPKEFFDTAFARLVQVIQTANITTGAEGTITCATQNDGLDRCIPGPDLQLIMQQPHHLQRQRVETLRAIKGQVSYMVTRFGHYDCLRFGH
jgi:hypothetical protein